ncbi:hypothetical protein [Dyadobacter sp. CY312]|uniref:hypothetical protein n=1 Tax=Dyadobacter sp. CY312 TaxID=2907303 RepID=UPI001F20D7C3|nr:hypothetical protein [Dyadobacter sp. CY312]MCE7040916.1 hypothetical protein [Dyadobacter sp. CY312]
MKTTIKFFAVLFTASFLYSCQSEEVIPSDVQYIHQTNAPGESTQDQAVKNNGLEKEKVQL